MSIFQNIDAFSDRQVRLDFAANFVSVEHQIIRDLWQAWKLGTFPVHAVLPGTSHFAESKLLRKDFALVNLHKFATWIYQDQIEPVVSKYLQVLSSANGADRTALGNFGNEVGCDIVVGRCLQRIDAMNVTAFNAFPAISPASQDVDDLIKEVCLDGFKMDLKGIFVIGAMHATTRKSLATNGAPQAMRRHEKIGVYPSEPIRAFAYMVWGAVERDFTVLLESMKKYPATKVLGKRKEWMREARRPEAALPATFADYLRAG